MFALYKSVRSRRKSPDKKASESRRSKGNSGDRLMTTAAIIVVVIAIASLLVGYILFMMMSFGTHADEDADVMPITEEQKRERRKQILETEERDDAW